METPEGRIGQRRDAARAAIQRPEWQGQLRVGRAKLNTRPRQTSAYCGHKGLDHGVHFKPAARRRSINNNPERKERSSSPANAQCAVHDHLVLETEADFMIILRLENAGTVHAPRE